MKLTSDEIKEVRKMKEILDKGHYCDSNRVAELYNKIMNSNVKPTRCTSCIRKYIAQMHSRMESILKEAEKKE